MMRPSKRSNYNFDFEEVKDVSDILRSLGRPECGVKASEILVETKSQFF